MEKKLMKSILVLLLLVIVGNTVTAQSLVIWQKDNSKVYYSLDAMPKTTFTNSELVITTTTDSISYPLSDVLRYTIETIPTGIGCVGEEGITISHNERKITVMGLQKGEIAGIYGVDGKQILTTTSNGTADVVVSLNTLPTGVYVFRAKNVKYKMIIK